MQYTIEVKRGGENENCYQSFIYKGESSDSIAKVLRSLNSLESLEDINGNKCDKIEWQHSCLVKKCGACAMRINGVPSLACGRFLSEFPNGSIRLEPLSKFPLVKDLATDRTVIFNILKNINVWLENNANLKEETKDLRYASSKCIMCGCCLEVCPNFTCDGSFTGVIAPVNLFRILDEEKKDRKNKLKKNYKKNYYEKCGLSLSCHNICPVGIPVDDLVARSNAISIWKRNI